MGNIPNNAKKPTDHKSKGPISIEYAGETYELDKDAIDLTVIDLIEREKFVTAVRSLIGDEAFERFTESVRTETGKVPLSEFQKFSETIFGALPN